MAYTAKIGGSAVNVVAGTLSVQNQIGQRSTGSLGVWSPLGVIYQYGTQVQVYDDGLNLVYAGFTVKDKVTKSGAQLGQGFLEHSITLMDNCYRADKRRVFRSYLGQTADFMVRDLLNGYLTAEGVSATATSIAPGPVITEAIYNGNKSVSDVLTWLAQQCGYWWNIDVTNTLFFQPYGGIPAPFTLDGTQVEAGVAQTLSVEFGNDMYVNKQFTKGGFTEIGTKAAPLIETFHGDGIRRGFTLSNPVNVLYQLVLNGADVTAQSATKTATLGSAAWYYAKGDATVAQDPSQAVLQPSDTLVVHYTGRVPIIAVAQNPVLVANQKAREGTGSGLVESTYTNTKVHTLTAAFQIASAMLGHYGQDTTVLEFSTRTTGLQPGQMLTVNLPDFTLNSKPMLISSVALSDQSDGINVWFDVQCVGSPYESAQWQTYYQNLMNQSSDPSDFTDADDTALAFLLGSVITRTAVVTVTRTATTCPICNNATLCGASSPVIC